MFDGCFRSALNFWNHPIPFYSTKFSPTICGADIFTVLCILLAVWSFRMIIPFGIGSRFYENSFFRFENMQRMHRRKRCMKSAKFNIWNRKYLRLKFGSVDFSSVKPWYTLNLLPFHVLHDTIRMVNNSPEFTEGSLHLSDTWNESIFCLLFSLA